MCGPKAIKTAVTLGLLAFSSSCYGPWTLSMPADCSVTKLSEVQSPGGTFTAAVVKNVCKERGKKTPQWSTLAVEVAKTDASSAPGGLANVYTSFGAIHEDGTREEPTADLKLEWKSDSELVIAYPPGQSFSCLSGRSDVKVHCVEQK